MDYRAGRPPEGPPMADPYPDTPRERQRTKLIRAVAITAAVTAVLVAVGIVWLAGAGGKARTEATLPAAGTPSASSTWDQDTVLACQQADQAAAGPVGEESWKKARLARNFAGLSDVPTLREVAAANGKEALGTPIDDTNAMTAAYEINTWCMTHKVR